MPRTRTTYADLWTDVQPETSRRMLLAALDAFATRGYSAATTREIAERAGLSPAAVYVHYSSKADLLYEISLVGSQSSLEAVEEAVKDAETPVDGLHRFVEAFVAWHARNHTLARVIQYEFRSLDADSFEEIAGLRRRCENLLRRELRRGVKSGDFRIEDLGATTIAILSLGIDVARWYSVDRGPSPEKLGARFADLALRMVGRDVS